MIVGRPGVCGALSGAEPLRGEYAEYDFDDNIYYNIDYSKVFLY